MAEKDLVTLDEATIRFAGDSGDGMQLTGSQFTNATAAFGNDLSTLPDYPSEIRAPAGTTFGVSGFQIHFGSKEIMTPGDSCDVLVAMNPAALKVNLHSLAKDGIIVVNAASFTEKNLKLAGYSSNPLEDGSLSKYKVYNVDISHLTALALSDMKLSAKEVDRCKNFFALGMMYWMFDRPLDNTVQWIEQKFAKKPELKAANIAVLKAGWNYGEAREIFTTRYRVKPAQLPPGTYRNISGNQATAWGLAAASVKARLPLFYGSYPITPASDILHELSELKAMGVKTFQAEDEIASMNAAIGAAYGGSLAATATSGPGLALKAEAIGLAVMTELPVVIVDVQRAGPSTGMPTKTEQADLLFALYGRASEAPLPVLAATTPSDCFRMAFEAGRIALKYMTPVILLTDGYLGNGSEPWKIPDITQLPDIAPTFHEDPKTFAPYLRDEHTLSRPWAIPGTPGLEHRIGGLEKMHVTGHVSHDPVNHERMVRLRKEKVERVAQDVPDADVEGPQSGDILVVGWGSTYGSIKIAVNQLRNRGHSVGHLQLRYLNPFPKNLGDVLSRYKKILVAENNAGQLVLVLRSTYLVPAISLTKIQGLPFKAAEIEQKVEELLEGAA